MVVSMAASVMRQDTLKPLHANLDWERLFRIADYNRIANLIYLAVLGNNDKVSERWKERFFERYSEMLKFNESADEGEREILVLLEMKKIPTVVLASSKRRFLYPREEMAGENTLKLFFIDSEEYLFAKGYLVNLGYETEKIYPSAGEKMKKPGGFSVEIYDSFPFKTDFYQNSMERLLDRAVKRKKSQYIYDLEPGDQLLYQMAQAAYLYVTDNLQIRQLADMYVLHRSIEDDEILQNLEDYLKDFRVQQLADKILLLAYMWFGTREECAKMLKEVDHHSFDKLEEHIFLNRLGAQVPASVNSEEMTDMDAEVLDLKNEFKKEEEKEYRIERKKLFRRRFREFLDLTRQQIKELYEISKK